MECCVIYLSVICFGVRNVNVDSDGVQLRSAVLLFLHVHSPSMCFNLINVFSSNLWHIAKIKHILLLAVTQHDWNICQISSHHTLHWNRIMMLM